MIDHMVPYTPPTVNIVSNRKCTNDIDVTTKGVNPEINNLSKEIIAQNKREFSCIRLGKDPRISDAPKWINTEEALQIYRNLLESIGGTYTVYCIQDLEDALKMPRMNIVGAPAKSEFRMICECVYNIYPCVSRTVGVQYAATIFMLLCKLNDIQFKFEIGEISDIFKKLEDHSIDCNTLERLLWDQLR